MIYYQLPTYNDFVKEEKGKKRGFLPSQNLVVKGSLMVVKVKKIARVGKEKAGN